jgi:hypothetical protein
MSLAIRPGIAVGPNINLKGYSVGGFTITLADIANPGVFSGLGAYAGNGSWVINQPFLNNSNSQGTTNCAMSFEAASPSVFTNWQNQFSTAGFDSSYSYAWNAVWASGQTCIVRLAIYPGTGGYLNDQMFIVPLDTTDTNWPTDPSSNIPAIQGTFTLPVTLTPYTPATIIDNNNWC